MESGAQGPANLVGQSVGGYRLERMLGTGAMGAVFLGQRLAQTPQIIEQTASLPRELPDVAAIKVLIFPWQLDAAARADFQARFVREAQTLQRLRHPNIVPVLADGADPATGLAYMILPYLSGGTLGVYVAGLPYPMPLGEVAGAIAQVASALDYAHSQGVVHRDIKPNNILLDGQGHVLVADFGIARLLVETQTQLTIAGTVLGTPEYMAPEQSDGRSVGPAADTYSLGMVAYQMVTGRPAFHATSIIEMIRLQAQQPPPPPHLLRPDLPPPCEAAILRALEKQPARRFATAGEFAQAFTLGTQGQWAPGQTNFVAPGVMPGVAPGAAPGARMGYSAQTFYDNPAVQYTQQPQRRAPLALLGAGIAALLLLACIGGAFFARDRIGALFQRITSNTPQGASVSPPVPTTVYAIGDNGTLDAFNSVTGDVQWSVDVGGQPANGLPGEYLGAVSDGVLFVTAAHADSSFPYLPGVGLLTAIDIHTHKILWATHTKVIYLAAQGGVVYVSDATGIAALNVRTDVRFWHYNEPQPYPLAFDLGENGTAYLSYSQGAQSSRVDAINLSDGSLLWRGALQGLALDSLVYSDGAVYATTRGSNFAQSIDAFSATDGQQLWSAPADGAGLDIAVANGLVYAHTTGSDVSGSLLVYNAQTGQQNGGFSSHSQPGACILSPPVFDANALYAPCSAPGHFVTAYGASSGSLIWQKAVAGDYIGVGSVDGGVVYAIGIFNGSDTETTTALQASNGASLWQHAGAYVAASKGVAFLSDNNTLTALNAATGQTLWQNATLGANVQALGS